MKPSRAQRKKRKQALARVQEQTQNAHAGVPLTRTPVIRCQDCLELADACECVDMDEWLERAANNGSRQNPQSLVLARVAAETLERRRARREAAERDRRTDIDARAFITAERERLRAEREAREGV